jgi:hypothetical protein
MLKTFIKDSIIYFIPTLISRGLGIILLPLYVYGLSPADFGSLDLLLVLASIVNLTIALEISQSVARFYATESSIKHKSGYASTAFWFTIACYTVFIIIMISLSSQFSEFILKQKGLEKTFQVGLFYIWIQGIYYLVLNQFRWELRSDHYTIISLTMSFTVALVSVWLVYFIKWGLFGLLISMTIGHFLATFLALWLLRTSIRFKFCFIQLKEMLSYSTPLVFSGVAVWVSLYIDRMMISHFLTIDDVGIYGIGYRVASISLLIFVGFQGALTPLVYKYYKKASTPANIELIFRFFIFLFLCVWLFLTLFSLDIVALVTTPEYHKASSVIIYLVPAICFAGMYIFSPGIFIAKKTHLVVWINIAGCSFNILLNYFLIPLLGIEGAAISTMLSSIAIFFLYNIIGSRFYFIPHQWFGVLSSICIATALIIFIPKISSEEFSHFIISITAIIAFILISILVGLIKLNEIKYFFYSIGHLFKKTNR